MFLLIPLSYISFRFLNLGEGVTGGLIQNLDDALASLGPIAEILGGALIGIILIFIFPIHWCIFYRPEDIGLLIAVTLPWILCCVIICGLSARTPKKAIHTSLAIGIGYSIISIVIYLIIVLIIPFGLGSVLLDGISLGLTDLPFLLATLTAIFEGCLVGGVFGAFMGSLRYNPGGAKSKKVKSKGKVEVSSLSEESRAIESTILTQETSCSNCGAKLPTNELFCTNCGAKSS
jgi:hypothetical protein